MDKKSVLGRFWWLFLIVIILIIGGLGILYYFWPKTTSKNETPKQAEIEKIYSGPYIDTHAHLITRNYTFNEAIIQLNKYNISKMILMETPVDLSNLLPSSEHGIPEAENYSQFAMMYQGEAIELLHQVNKRGSFTTEEKSRFISLLEDAAQSGKYVGFGELALRHYPQPNLTGAKKEARDITISGDHEWMTLIAQIGAKYNMPLDVHIEPDENTLPGVEKLISQNPNTKFIFDHAGWYNTGKGTPELFNNLLGKYSNLYTSIKIRTPQSLEQKAVAIFDDNGKILDSWKQVFIKYQDQFLCGSDIKFGIDSAGEGDLIILDKYHNLLEQLPYETAEKIATKNAESLFQFK